MKLNMSAEYYLIKLEAEKWGINLCDVAKKGGWTDYQWRHQVQKGHLAPQEFQRILSIIGTMGRRKRKNELNRMSRKRVKERNASKE